MADVIMPKMSDAMTEGKILAWRKRVGDRVARGEVIAEIETDKVNVEIEAETAGTLSDILVQAGEQAPVGGVIAHINGGGGASAAPAAAAVKAAPAGGAELASTRGRRTQRARPRGRTVDAAGRPGEDFADRPAPRGGEGGRSVSGDRDRTGRPDRRARCGGRRRGRPAARCPAGGRQRRARRGRSRLRGR